MVISKKCLTLEISNSNLLEFLYFRILEVNRNYLILISKSKDSIKLVGTNNCSYVEWEKFLTLLDIILTESLDYIETLFEDKLTLTDLVSIKQWINK